MSRLRIKYTILDTPIRTSSQWSNESTSRCLVHVTRAGVSVNSICVKEGKIITQSLYGEAVSQLLSDPRAAVYSWPSLTKRRTKLVIMRNFFLMCSQSRWLREHAAKHRFVRRAVSRFMPGETVSDALAAAVALRGGSIGNGFTRLGENGNDANEAVTVTTH